MGKRATTRAKAAGIHDLSALVQFEVLQVEQDAGCKRPMVYLAEMRSELLPAPIKCILKAYPAISEGDMSFERELAANAHLSELSFESASDAVTAFPTVLKERTRRWPHCLGFLDLHRSRVTWPDNLQQGKLRQALLFEYFPNLTPVEPRLLNQRLVGDFLSILTDLHARNLLHRDLTYNQAWPEIAFRNMFIQNRGSGSQGIILDFNVASVLGTTARDKAMKEDEFERVELYLVRGMAGKKAVDHIPAEVQRLLAS